MQDLFFGSSMMGMAVSYLWQLLALSCLVFRMLDQSDLRAGIDVFSRL